MKWTKEAIDAVIVGLQKYDMLKQIHKNAEPTSWNGQAAWLQDKFEIERTRVELILHELKLRDLLKDPPQPREIWWCPICNKISTNIKYIGTHHQDKPLGDDGYVVTVDVNCSPIKMREVIDE